jgi:ketosteroid isomerase-like protein
MPELSHEQHIRQLNESYVRAAVGGDIAWFQSHLADEFVCIESDGSVHDKTSFLTRTAQGSDLATYTLDSVEVRFYGDVALVRCTGLWVTKDGVPGMSRYVDIYAPQDGTWKAVSAQITRPAM